MLFSFEASTSQDGLQRSDWDVLSELSGYCNDHALFRMLELSVAAFGSFESPAVGFQHSDQIPNLHLLILAPQLAWRTTCHLTFHEPVDFGPSDQHLTLESLPHPNH